MGSKLILLLGLVVGGLLTFFCVNEDKRQQLFNYKNTLNKGVTEVKHAERVTLIPRKPSSVAVIEDEIKQEESIKKDKNIEIDVNKEEVEKKELEKLKDTEEKISKLLADNPIYFKINSTTIKEESKKELNMIIEALKGISTKTVVVIKGHTDAFGKASLNKKLSQERADSVMLYLKEGGLDSLKMRAIGYGEEQPIVVNNPNDKLNRRVEIELKRGE